MRLYLAIALSSISLLTYAGQATLAPVVDAGQDSQNTQVESVGSSWQSMQHASSDANADTDSDADSESTSSSASQADLPPARAMTSSTDAGASSGDESGGALNERVDRLSQQVANITRMNLPQQVSDARQTLSQLQGEIEVAQRDLKMISQQQARLYQDLSTRIEQLKSGKSDAGQADTAQAAKPVKLTDASSYQKAFKLLSAKQFDQASDAFTMYLKDYPKGRFAANAHYWLGEIAMQNKAYGDAYAQFQLLIAQYPQSNKVADAKLKVAVIHARRGEKKLAKIEFDQVRKGYPGSTAAQLASIQLQQMQN